MAVSRTGFCLSISGLTLIFMITKGDSCILFAVGGQPAPSTASNPSPTTTTAASTDFQPDRPIGYGAFGVVWSVTDPRDGKRVALKKLPNVFQSLVSSKRNVKNRFIARLFN
jgi:serine/threonine protein kinase